MQGSALPPSDRVVVTLWRRGMVSSAMDYARAALGRNDRHHSVLTEQLEALRSGQPLDDHGEDVELTVEVVGAMVDRFRYHEARCLLRAVAHEAAGPIGKLLDTALAPFPKDADPSYGALLELVRVGQAPSALRALEEVMAQLDETPEWLVARDDALRALVSGEWRALLEPVADVTRDTVLERLRQRDLPGALTAARAAGATELAARLDRLLEAAQRETSGKDDNPADQRTLPIEGLGMAMFQVRMGALDSGDSALRKLLRSNPDQEEVRRILADVLAVRRALGADVAPMPARGASVHWLSKTAGASTGKWTRTDEAHPRYGDDDAEEESTNVLNAAHEAELLLKLGKTEQALSVYKLLAIRHPHSDEYKTRIREIEALIEHNLQPVAVEVTAKHDLSKLIEKSLPTGAKHKIDMRPTSRSFPRFAELDDGPTLVDGDDD